MASWCANRKCSGSCTSAGDLMIASTGRINLVKMAGARDQPNGKATHYNHYPLMLKLKYYLINGCMRTWWYPSCKSREAPNTTLRGTCFSQFKVSYVVDIVGKYLLIGLRSTTNLKPPSFLGTKKAEQQCFGASSNYLMAPVDK